ncbi:MAG: hypothetical protein RBR12_03000, partial [Sulfurospirillum cavolei]|nr:hypothetical protein [Sulfurospirillum cavolei]
MKKTTYFCLVLVSLFLIPSSLSASTVKGKIFYAKILKPVCGFNGDVMGKKHTVSEWKQFYENNQLSL